MSYSVIRTNLLWLNGVVWWSLSKQRLLLSGSRCGGSLSKQGVLQLHGPPLHFSIYYDSLIEKCSTLSRPSVSSGVPCFSHLSLACEWSERGDRTNTGTVSDTLEHIKQRRTRSVGRD
jgi:hypothetical protein